MNATLTEIRNQPISWRETLDYVPGKAQEILESVGTDLTAALFMGCGTSLYISQSAAQSFREITGISASAIPGSEAFITPQSSLPKDGKVLAFVISRSGTTSEAIMAAKALKDYDHITTVAVTCNADTELEKVCDHALVMPWATEKSVVMTQSFSTMLMATELFAATLAGDEAVIGALRKTPDILDEQFESLIALTAEVGGPTSRDATITLGLGPLQGIAEEGTLKLKEMTQSICEAYNPLEFRHGPISIVTDKTLVVYLQTEREAEYADAVVRDLKDKGATVIAAGPKPSANADHTFELGADLGDLGRCVLYVPFVQMIAYARTMELGLNPDTPRNLTQVVVLNG